ncbi:MAG: LytTR family DNA-binding domain-containing protein [Acetatifactor sp.]
MKFRISVSPEKREELERFLKEHGIETDPNAAYAIVEESHYPDFLSARDRRRENVRIAIEDVIFIEAFGKEIEIHTLQDTFYAQDRIYQLEELLNPRAFLRISKSVIIAKKHVKKIRPSLSMKYILTMTDGTLVDVTRSYYSEFRRFFNI